MDEFKSEDELRPDSSDRRPPRQRKGPSVPKLAVSKQHMMIGIGVLVLLLLVIAIGSALKSPTRQDSGAQNSPGAEKSIQLPGATDTNAAAPSPDNAAPGGASPSNGVAPAVNGGNGLQQPQTLSAPPVASTPTVAPPVNDGNPQHRIDLPGNMADALSQQGSRVNGMTQQMNGDGSTLPTAPATVAPVHKAAKPEAHSPAKPAASSVKNTVPAHSGKTPVAGAAQPAAAGRHTMVIEPAPRTSGAGAHGSAGGSIQSAPSGYYTVQISSASQAATLNAYAKKQQLGQYWVYETRRSGKPWYVLVSGVYPTSAQAKSAVAQLPPDIQAKKPWPREIGQVKQDQNK